MSAHPTSVRERLRDAAGMTLVVYAARSACALLLVLPLLGQLAPELSHSLYDARLGPAEVAALLEVAARSGRRLLFWTLGCLSGYALLSPLLALAWLCALARRQSIAASLARAATFYLPALALGGCALVGWSASFAAAALALQPELASALPHSAPLERAWTSACVAALALCGLLIATVHDLARAELARGARLRPAVWRAVALLNPGLLGRHALFVAAIAAVTVVAELTGRPLAVPATIVLAVQQLLVLGTTLLRGGWLALVLNASESAGTGRAELADGDLDAERLA